MIRIRWLGHASFMISLDDKIVYIDPFAGEDYSEKADLVLLSHGHYDHCNVSRVREVSVDSTEIIAAPECRSDVGGERFRPGMKKDIDGITIEAIPAYNLSKEFHPMESGGLGFIITYKGVSIYHAGDTDLIPEMEGIHPTIALLPVGGTYTMDAKTAARAASIMKPKLAVPMHYGKVAGSVDDAEEFRELVEAEDIKVKVFEEGEEIDVDEYLG